jgi:uncharacterized protein (TIGR02145 family)
MKPIGLLLLTFCILSCKKDEAPIVDTSLRVITGEISNIQRFQANIQGTAFGDSILVKGVVCAFHPLPTLDSNEVMTFHSHGNGSFEVIQVGLLAGHTYYVRAFATTANDTVYGAAQSFYSMYDPCELVSNVFDQWYSTVTIGSQCWMDSNLKAGLFNNKDNMAGAEGAFDLERYEMYYGHSVLADPRGVCPPGYRVPTLEDWTIMAEWIGGWKEAGYRMKYIASDKWPSGTSGDNTSGFRAIPNGYGVYNTTTQDVDFIKVNTEARFAILDFPGKSAILRHDTHMLMIEDDPLQGIYKSCRCVKDQ